MRWQGDVDGHLVLLDQTRLPAETAYLDCRTVEDVWQAIKRLSVRGAPAIGVAAAYGVCVGVNEGRDVDRSLRLPGDEPPHRGEPVLGARPHASGSEPGRPRPRSGPRSGRGRPGSLVDQLLAEARAIHDEDRQQCAAMAKHGADLLADLPPGAGILTHCNAGALATGGDGTALAVIFELARRGKRPHVWADETRPLLQGARLTMWELMQRGIEATLICDSAAAQVMREGRVQAVITGADRIAANGDTANKIGTYSVATLAQAHDIPFYVAAPATTFDLSIATGAEIPIEQRAAEEITHGFGLQTAPAGVAVYNPAFDVTPAELIAAIITDRGVMRPVDGSTVRCYCVMGAWGCPAESRCSTGVVVIVVASAMMTIIANSVGEMTPSSRPMLSTISSISPRVFIRTPSAADVRQSRPVNRAAATRAAELAERGDENDHRRKAPRLPTGNEADLGPHARVREERRQQQDLDDVFELMLEVERHIGVVRNDRPQQERAENRVDADPLGRHRRKQQRHQHPHRHPALRRTLALCPRITHGQRPHDDQHDGDVTDGVQNRLHGAAHFWLVPRPPRTPASTRPSRRQSPRSSARRRPVPCSPCADR